MNTPTVVYGKTGLGKSFATDLVTASLDISTYWVDMPDQPKGKETTVRIHKAIFGTTPPMGTPEYILTDEVVDGLDGRNCVVVIDEAQNLPRPALRQLRYYHDNRKTEFTLVLVGCDLKRHISVSVPELANRVGRWISFRPFALGELRDVLDAYHPIFANADTEVLLKIHDAVGGCFRNWARVLEISHTLGLDNKGRLDAADVSVILHAFSTPVTDKKGQAA